MMSDSESDGDEDQILLTINEHYAKAYAHRKEREELSKCTLQFKDMDRFSNSPNAVNATQ